VTRGIIKDHATGRARRRRRERAARRHAYRPEKKRCGPTSHSEQYRMIRDPSGVSNFRIIFLIRTVPPPPTNPNPNPNPNPVAAALRVEYMCCVLSVHVIGSSVGMCTCGRCRVERR
jgi:hypothetical protein